MENPIHEQDELQQQQQEVPPPFLPDDVVLHIMQRLPLPQLLAARVVCRRWANLALHADVWRGRRLDDAQPGVFGAALRLAPCARTLVLAMDAWPRPAPRHEGPGPARSPGGGGGGGDSEEAQVDVHVALSGLARLAVATRCAARCLVLGCADRDAGTANGVLGNQAALGRLEELRVSIDRLYLGLSDPCWELVKTACACQGLTELSLSCKAAGSPRVPKEKTGASLKKLRCALLDESSHPILEYLLACHEDTLEELAVSFFHPPLDVSLRFPAEALARATRLRELECQPMRGMSALAKCESLERFTLKLNLRTDWFDVLREAKDFLREAVQLRSLTIDDPFCCHDPPVLAAVDLVEALASSRRSAVEVLGLHLSGYSGITDDGGLLSRLAAALGQLEALREVQVDLADGDTLLQLMQCLSGSRALSLRVKSVRGIRCLHAWIHLKVGAIMNFFDVCPMAHLDLDCRRGDDYHCNRPECFACGLRCHGQCAGGRVVLYGHSDGERCDAPHHADAWATCHRITRARPPR